MPYQSSCLYGYMSMGVVVSVVTRQHKEPVRVCLNPLVEYVKRAKRSGLKGSTISTMCSQWELKYLLKHICDVKTFAVER